MAVESLFTTQTPSLSDLNDASYTLGTAFKTLVPGNVTGIRMYVANSSPTSSPVGALYLESSYHSGPLLTSKAFGTLNPNQWNSILFDTPQHIDETALYVAAAGPLNVYNALPFFFSSNDYENGNLQAKDYTFGGNGRFSVNSALTYPVDSFHATLYFIDLLFEADTAAPEQYTNNRDFFSAAAW